MVRYKTKKPRPFGRDCCVFKIHHHETVVSTLRLPLTQFHAGFVCNFLSSSAGINLCRCFSRLTLVLRLSLGFHFHGLLPLPLLFLTSAVFAFFRPLQFWILTTQPLFLPFPSLPVSASQWLPQCSSSGFPSDVLPRSFLPGFPCILSRFPVLSLAECFLSPFPDSLPQPFLRCLPSALASGLFHFPFPFFRLFPFRFRLLSLLLLPFCPLAAPPHSWLLVQARFLTSPSLLPFIHGWFPVRFLPVLHTRVSVRFLSSFPASLPQPFHRCFPFRFPLRDRCLTSASFRPLPS